MGFNLGFRGLTGLAGILGVSLCFADSSPDHPLGDYLQTTATDKYISDLIRVSDSSPDQESMLQALTSLGKNPRASDALVRLGLKKDSHQYISALRTNSPFFFVRDYNEFLNTEGLSCTHSVLQSLLVQFHIESKKRFLLKGQGLYRLYNSAYGFIQRCLKENDSFLLIRLLPKALGISMQHYSSYHENQEHLINRIRNDAEYLGGVDSPSTGLDPHFWIIRKDIHRDFNRSLIKFIEDYLEKEKVKYGKPYDYHLLEKEWGEKLIGVPKEYDPITSQDFVKGNEDLLRLFLLERMKRDLNVLFQNFFIETALENVSTEIIANRDNILKELNSKKSARDKLEITLNLGTEARRYFSLLAETETDTNSEEKKTSAAISLLSLINGVVTSNFVLLRDILDEDPQAHHDFKFLQQFVDALWLEGLLSNDQKDHTKYYLSRLSTDDPQNQKRLRDFLQYIYGLAESRLQDNFAAAAQYWGQFDSDALTMIESIERSSAMLRLSTVIDRLRSENLAYESLSSGEAKGILRRVNSPSEYLSLQSSENDVLILGSGIQVVGKQPFAALLSESPLLEGSHMVTLARQGGQPRPCAFSPDFLRANDKKITTWIGRTVKVSVTPEGCLLELTEDTVEEPQYFNFEVDTNFSKRSPLIDLTDPIEIQALKLDNEVGGKALHFGEIYHVLSSDSVQAAFATPYYFYDEFIHTKLQGRVSLAERIEYIHQKHSKWSQSERRLALAELRYFFLQQAVPESWLNAISEKLVERYGRNTKIRFRSSSNLEDRSDFNAAGLHDSYAAISDNVGSIENAIRMVYASMWNDRAFAARVRAGVDQRKMLMGILVHPSHRKETANGVVYTAISRNHPDTMRIAVQIDKESVTNPTTMAQPEIIEVNREHDLKDVRVIKRSSMIAQYPLLTQEEIQSIQVLSRKLHHYFGYPLDIEFKRMKGGKILFKQARPYTPASH